MSIQSVNPANGVLLRSFTPLTDQALLEKISLAQDAFAHYGEVPLSHRALCMRKLADLLERETADLAALITAEMGKPVAQARSEIVKCASVCRYYADHAERILAPEPIDIGSSDAYVRWYPLGVVLAVMPWNFPFWQVFRFLAPALMAGNAGLLKHASNVPQCAIAIEELVRRAGFPRGTFQTLLIHVSQVETVLADPRVVAATVTGSELAGRAIAAQAGWLIKKTVLELGGSDPFIVLDGADLPAVAKTAAAARMENGGQACNASKRMIVAEGVYDDFMAEFTAAMSGYVTGDPTDPATGYGPLSSEQAAQNLMAQLEDAVRKGATVHLGGHRLDGPGAFVEPTVLSGVTPDMRAFGEELFGPAAVVYKVAGADEAVELANSSAFGLGGSVFSSDQQVALDVADRLDVGMVWINSAQLGGPELPFGGTKRSGVGRELGPLGIDEFVNKKLINIVPIDAA